MNSSSFVQNSQNVLALRCIAQCQALAQPLRTYYLYADEGLIAESTQAITLNADGSVTAGAAPQITTQYGPGPNSEFTTGVLFVKTNNSNNQQSFAYLHHDHLQTPLQATDKAGNVVWAASYNAFGKAAITTPVATADKPTINLNLRLPGQHLDEETGLHYNWYRFYDNETGRYVTGDPIGLLGGINRYRYVGGNPLSGIDPKGLSCTAKGNIVSCTAPGGPTFTVPRPTGWPDEIAPGQSLYHSYNVQVPGSCANPNDLRQRIVNNPTPGSAPKPASSNGTPNDANPQWFEGFVIGLGAYGGDSRSPLNPVLPYTRIFNGQTIVVNVTQPGHTLFPGYVARVVDDRGGKATVNNFGEGLALAQSDFSPVAGLIKSTWKNQSQGLINQSSTCKCP